MKSTILCGKTYFASKISQQVLRTTICSSFASRLNFCVVMRVFFHCLWMNIQLMNPVSAVLNAFICSHKFVCSHVCLCVFLYNFCVLSEIEKVYVRACLLLMRKKRKKIVDSNEHSNYEYCISQRFRFIKSQYSTHKQKEV